MTDDDPHDGTPEDADDLFAAAGRGPATSESDGDDDGEDRDGELAETVRSADSPFPDGSGGEALEDQPPPDDAVPAVRPQRYRRPPPGSFGYHTPPPSTPDGLGGYRAGPYPAGPPTPPRPQFGRRAPQRGPQPDADGYYPGDYYLGTDWTRVVVKGLATLVLGIAAVIGGLYVVDRYDPRDEDEAVEAPTPTPVPLVAVYECAGDPQPVSEIPAPETVLIAGRTADSRWLAFRNPSAPPRQLWVRAALIPAFEPSTVGIVSCASTPQDFPTPVSAPTPVAQTDLLPSGPPDTTPTPVSTPTPTGT